VWIAGLEYRKSGCGIWVLDREENDRSLGNQTFDVTWLRRIFLCALVKLRKATVSFVVCVRPHGTTLLPVNGFSWNLIFEDLSNIFREHLSVIKIGRELRVLYMKTNIHFWSYLARFFVEWEMFQTKVVEKIKTQFFLSSTFFFFRKSYRLWDNVEKYCRTGKATDDNMAHAHCMLDT
jgi:hypothetical protein